MNCNQTCTCGRGSLTCDPVKGCICKAGWTGVNCDDDVNECDEPTTCGDDVNKICVNSVGSYSCVCGDGYTKVSNTCEGRFIYLLKAKQRYKL